MVQKCPYTSKKSNAHLQCVHNNCAKFEECQPKGVNGVDYTKLVPSIQNMLEKPQSLTACTFFGKVQTFPKNHTYIFNMSVICVQSLKKVSLKDYTK
jgi:hypothetical protein